MSLYKNRRQVDFQIIAKWVEDGDRILDLGCGRGILLEYLQQKSRFTESGWISISIKF